MEERYKPIKLLIASILVALFSSVFLFEQNVHAQEIRDPLINSQPTLEQAAILVEQKYYELQRENEKTQNIDNKKTLLENKVDNLKDELGSLKQQVADKKAEAEAERLRAAKEASGVVAEKKRVAKLQNMFVYVNRYAGNSAGNLYAAGNCTWYAKSMRPDLPNNLGNANTWYYNAQAQGWSVGLKPKKGAVATTTTGGLGHVAYVIGVSLDGQQVTIREMNYRGLYNMSTRTVHYTEFKYIYGLN